MICDVMRRMNALSSTTSTRGNAGRDPAVALKDTRPLSKRPHLDATGEDVEIHASSVVAARVLADDWNLRIVEHVAHGGDVPFADVDAARRNEIAEHARAADDLCRDAFG